MQEGTFPQTDHALVSVVIPTRNRRESLARLLRSLEAQTYPVNQVIIVDASDLDQGASLAEAFHLLPLVYLHSRPHVCAQRNSGIRAASSEYVFLCDDDIELSGNYVQSVIEFLLGHPECGAASGLLLEPSHDGEFGDGSRSLTLTSILAAFVFQLGVWGDVERMKSPRLFSPLAVILRKYYSRRGNTFTLAGWPLFTQITHPLCKTAVYGLGASIVRRRWLLDSPFDESLDEHGIGDNFGVALGFPGDRPIAVLPGTTVKHHKIPQNRLSEGITYHRRVLALHYFMSRDRRFTAMNRLALLWSILGHYLVMTLRGNSELRGSIAKSFLLILLQRNPLIKESHES